MYSTNQTNQAPTSSPSQPAMDLHRTSSAPSQQTQNQCPPSQPPQQPQLSSYGTTAPASRQPNAKVQETRTATQEPYPTQESTWWEEGVSPHPSRAEEGYGQSQAQHRAMYGDQNAQHHEVKHSQEQGVINWSKVAKIICAVLLPPLGVFLETGCDKSFAINVLLTLLGYIPGIIHAIYVIITD